MWQLGPALVLIVSMATPAESQTLGARGVADELKGHVEMLRTAGSVQLGSETVLPSEVTLGVYERRGFEPLWTNQSDVLALVDALAEVHWDGLTPDHYHWSTLAILAENPVSERAAALDLLATDALVRISHDLRFGKVEPMGPVADGSPWPFGGADPVADLVRVVASGQVREELLALRPDHFVYRGLQDALVELRRIEDAGGWASLPAGPAMQRDMLDPRVPLLRRRLAVEGYAVSAAQGEDPRFDVALESAVKLFQRRHGLNEDGVVGRITFAEMNVPVERRVEQVRINLERARWMVHGLPDTFVAVNVAGAKVHFVRGDSVLLEARAIMGRDVTRTPVFSAPMRYIDLNPTWTVPPGIVAEILAGVRSDPAYLQSHSMSVLDGAGHTVDPASIDFSRYTPATFPYFFRQEPGPTNPLGRIKFVFPNGYNVYLHDTPERGLFEREERLFSHGCIRVQDPLALAELILDDSVNWSREALQADIDSGSTLTIPLARPLPVLVLYWTAAADPRGEVRYYRDVYGRDALVLAGLDGN